MRESVKIVNAALDEVAGDEIVLRGVIDPDSLGLLKVAAYQREIMPMAKISALIKAFGCGSVPDIDLGMRGQSYRDHDEAFYLSDPIYIIDGLQRVTAAKEFLKRPGDRPPHLGAVIHFGTTEEWERERFRILNADRMRLSANVLVRNLREDIPAIRILYALSQDASFVLGNRVCWGQRMHRDHLITGMTLLRTTSMLHARFGPGRSSSMEEMARGLQKILDNVGPIVLRDNIRTFFGLIDECWGVKAVVFKEGAKYLRATFMSCLADVLTRHSDFWRDKRLHIERDLARKIAQFPVNDPNIGNLASAGGQARQILFQLMVEHINSGKRTRRLSVDEGLRQRKSPKMREVAMVQ